MGRGIDDMLSEGGSIEKDFEDVNLNKEAKKAIAKEKERLIFILRDKILKRERLLSVNESFYRLEQNTLGGGLYRKVDDREVAIAVERISGKSYSRKVCGDVIDVLHNACYKRRESINDNKRCINVLNGVLDVESRTLRPFIESDLYTYQIPILYDPNALCDEWREFLKFTFERSPENVALLQTICGYCLQIAHNSEKFFVFYGSGGNGKGVVTYVMESILGVENCTSLGLEKLGDSQWSEALVDKMLNLATESDSRASKWSETLKIAVSGEALVVNPKYKDRYKFYPFAKHIITMNERPYLEDKSDGVMRRMIVIPFERTVAEEDMDIGLKRRLVELEGSGILNWFLEGLGMYLKGGFVVPEANKALAREIKVESNSVMMFFEEMCESMPFDTCYIPTDEFYDRYVDFCKKSGYKAFSKSRVTRCLHTDYKVECFLKKENNKVFRIYGEIAWQIK